MTSRKRSYCFMPASARIYAADLPAVPTIPAPSRTCQTHSQRCRKLRHQSKTAATPISGSVLARVGQSFLKHAKIRHP